jgi:hypothetical protein
MKKLSLLFIGTIFIVAFNGLSWGQTISYTTTGAVITQDFNTLPASGTPTFAGNGPYQLSDPAGTPGTGVGASGMTGWYGCKYGGTGTVLVFKIDAGTNASGAVISYGTGTTTERSLGMLGSGTTIPEVGALFTNNTAFTLGKFTITFTGEQWKSGSATPNILHFSYKVGATAINDVSGFQNQTALDFTSPILSAAGALNGDISPNRTTGITFTIAGISWAPGAVLAIRWQKSDDAGSDDGLAIEDCNFSADVFSVVQYYYKGSGLLNSAANWNTDPSGTGGSTPANMTSEGQVWNIRNTSAVSTSGTGGWTVSALGSKIVVGDGISACALTIASGANITGTVDVSANGTVVLQDASPTWGSISTTSTIDYAQTGTVQVSNGPVYGNLKMTGGTKTLGPSTTTVKGNLVIDGVTNLDGNASFSTIALSGNLTFQGGTTFIASDANRFTLLLNGISLQTITGESGNDIKVFKITLNNSAGFVLAGSTTHIIAGGPSGGGIAPGTGNLTTGSNTITIYPSASASITPFETTTSYVIGNVSCTKTVGTAVSSSMGSLLWGSGIQAGNFADNLGDVTVLRKTGTDGIVTVSGKSGIQCTWTISSVNPPASGRSILLGWLNPTLLNGKTITTMQAWKSEDGGTSWHLAGSQYDATTSTKDSLGVNSFGMFTISDAANPLGVTTPSMGITALIQGFSDGVSKMLFTAPVTVQLRDASTFALVTSQTGTLDLYGTHTFNFPGGTAGTNYWVVIKSVNAVETYSKTATSCTSDFVFDTLNTKAYGNNEILKGTRWCIYNGDVNQDGAVDGLDLGAVDNDNNAFVTGNPVTDLNGDGTTDGLDLGLVDNNNNAFVSRQVPPGAPTIKHVRIQAKTVTPQQK